MKYTGGINPVLHVYSIQHYVIKFVSDLWQGTPVSSTNKNNRHDITEILLKVELNTITLTQTPKYVFVWSEYDQVYYWVHILI